MSEVNFNPFPNLSTNRLNLRKMNLKDDKEIFSLHSNPTVNKFLSRSPDKTVDDSKGFISRINEGIETDKWIMWGITQHNDNHIIGTICFWNLDLENYRSEIGFELHPDFHGKGIMQEALTKIIEYGFREMNLHSVEAQVNPDNLSSIKLLSRNNFVREAYFKEKYFFRGKFVDAAIYSLLPK